MEPENAKPSIEHSSNSLRDQEDETPFLDHDGEAQKRDENDLNPQDDNNVDSSGPVQDSSNAEDHQNLSSQPNTQQIPGYDPNRIPASIFSTKPTTGGGEWSVASNESLFSIQMGNNSFSRDYAILYGKSGDLSKMEEVGKSGEFPRLEEWNKDDNSNNKPQFKKAVTKSSELAVLPPVMEESSVHHGDELPRVDHEKKDESENTNKPPFSCPSPSPSTNSDVGNNSCNSFVFPVLVNEEPKKGNEMEVVTEIPEQPKPESQPEPEVSRKESTPDSPVIIEDTGWCSYFMCWPNCLRTYVAK